MTDYTQVPGYQECLQVYVAMFSQMSDMGRALWFFAADEDAILSFEVGQDETISEAQKRHGIKLIAMADALQSVDPAGVQKSCIDSLRQLAKQHLRADQASQ